MALPVLKQKSSDYLITYRRGLVDARARKPAGSVSRILISAEIECVDAELARRGIEVAA